MTSAIYLYQPSNPQQSNSGGENNKVGVGALFAFEAMLTELENAFIQNENSQASQQAEMGNVMVNNQEKQYKNYEKEIKEQEEQSHESFWDKLKDVVKVVVDTVASAGCAMVGDISAARSEWQNVEQNPELQNVIKGLTYLVAAVTTIVGVVTGNLELVAVTVGLLALSQTGLLKDATKEVSKGLQDLGIPADVANVTADVIVALAVVAAGSVAGIGASLETVSEDVSEEAGEEASDAVQERTFNVKKFVGMNLMSVGMGVNGVNFAEDIAKLADGSGKKEEQLQEILSILSAVVSAGAAIAGGGLTLTASSEASTALSDAVSNATSKVTTYLQETFPRLVNTISDNMASISSFGRYFQSGAQALQGIFEGANAGNDFRLAGIFEQQGVTEKNMTFLNAALKNNNQDQTQTGNEFKNGMQMFQSFWNDVTQLFSGYQAEAQALIS